MPVVGQTCALHELPLVVGFVAFLGGNAHRVDEVDSAFGGGRRSVVVALPSHYPASYSSFQIPLLPIFKGCMMHPVRDIIVA